MSWPIVGAVTAVLFVAACVLSQGRSGPTPTPPEFAGAGRLPQPVTAGEVEPTASPATRLIDAAIAWHVTPNITNMDRLSIAIDAYLAWRPIPICGRCRGSGELRHPSGPDGWVDCPGCGGGGIAKGGAA